MSESPVSWYNNLYTAAGFAAAAAGEGKNVATSTMIQLALLVVVVLAGAFAAYCAKKHRSEYIEGCIYAGVAALGLAIMLGLG